MLIQKNGTTLNVTRGAFLSLFKDKGWKTINDTSNDKKSMRGQNFMAPQPEKEPEKVNTSEMPFGNMMQQPEIDLEMDEEAGDYDVVFEDMTIKQLIEYADDNDIDLDGVSKKADIISVIEKAEKALEE